MVKRKWVPKGYTAEELNRRARAQQVADARNATRNVMAAMARNAQRNIVAMQRRVRAIEQRVTDLAYYNARSRFYARNGRDNARLNAQLQAEHEEHLRRAEIAAQALRIAALDGNMNPPAIRAMVDSELATHEEFNPSGATEEEEIRAEDMRSFASIMGRKPSSKRPRDDEDHEKL